MQRNLNKAHLLVTGGAGFMGSAFIEFVLNQKEFVGHLSNLDCLTYAGNLKNLEAVATDQRYTFYLGDIRNPSLLETIQKKRALTGIVHFAAETHVDRSILDPSPFVETNIVGTHSLLKFLRRHPEIHFHQISTDEVYGALGPSGIFTEDSPYRPNSPYAASKASADHLVRSYSITYNLSTTLSHASNNYGPRQFPEKFIPCMIQRILESRELPVYGTGENVREWLFVEDHARAIWTILQKGAPGEVYNVGGGAAMKNIELIDLLFEIVEEMLGEKRVDKRITFVSDRPGHDFRYALDGSKLKELGYSPLWSLKEGLQKTVQSLMKRGIT